MAVDYQALANTGLYSDKKIASVQKALAPAPSKPSSSYSLVDPSGKSTSITAEQAGSYTQGANSLASGYRVVVPTSVPNGALNGGLTMEDVKDKRNSMDATQTAGQQFQSYLTSQGTSAADAASIAGFMFPEQDPNLTKAYEGERSMLTKAGDYLSGLLGGKSSAEKYQGLLDKGGYGDAQTALMDSNERLARLRGEQMKIRPQIEGEAGQTRIGAEARLNPVERQLTAEIGAEALIQATLSGNLQMIEQNATKLMEFEFADQDRELKIFEQRIKLEQARIDSLTGQSKDQAAARLAAAELMLQDRQNALDAAKDEKSQLIDFAQDYLKATGDGAGAADILRTGSLQSAVTKYGSRMQDTGGTSDNFIKSGAATFPKSTVQATTATLQASKDWAERDEYVNTPLYFSELSNWVSDGGLEADFVKYFPSHWLNPSDPTVPKWFKDKYMSGKSDGIPDTY